MKMTVHRPTTSDSCSQEVESPMNSATYFEIFREQGFYNIKLRETLKHLQLIPTVYFNRKRSGFVYFTILAEERARFSDNLWVFIDACQKKDNKPNFCTVIPKLGKERIAFSDIIAK